VQRSGSKTTDTAFPLGLQKRKKSTNSRRFTPSASDPADALAAVEPPHDQRLTRMAFAEQQRWVTVQQKTFTKWYLCLEFLACSMLTFFFPRLNTKIEARNLEVKDLVKDLSDGVSVLYVEFALTVTDLYA
jgi:hypothetical protein